MPATIGEANEIGIRGPRNRKMIEGFPDMTLQEDPEKVDWVDGQSHDGDVQRLGLADIEFQAYHTPAKVGQSKTTKYLENHDRGAQESK
jgi:hypothetical protein